MRNKTPLIWLIAGLAAALAIVLSGCSTDKPWEPNTSGTFTLYMISGPTDSLQVPLGSSVSYNWSYNNGTGAVQYQHSYDGGEWTALSNETVATVSNLTLGYHSFGVRAVDGAGATSEVSAVFGVVETSTPTVVITESPAIGSFVASGSSVTFSWEGDDGNVGPNYLTYQYTFAGVTSEWLPTNTVTISGVASADSAVFSVRSRDIVGHNSEWASTWFVIKDADILFVDDFSWTNSFGDVDNAIEREEKQFYRDALQGFAFAEWDIHAQGIPSPTTLQSYSTVIWVGDSHLGTTDYTWADPDVQTLASNYLNGGGHMILAGALILADFKLDGSGDYIPTAPTDIEYVWFGVDSTTYSYDSTWWAGGEEYDTLIVNPDSITVDTIPHITWDYWDDFTWAVKDVDATLSLPDSMKIDVAKNGDQVDYAVEVHNLRNDATVTSQVLFRWGLTVDGEEAAAYMEPIGHLVNVNGAARTAMLNFDAYSMPMLGIRQTFHSILGEFGETPSF
jgi:hypothetical protein